jgi:hypothetical protein
VVKNKSRQTKTSLSAEIYRKINLPKFFIGQQ